MKYQFARLFVLLVLLATIIIFSFGEIYSAVTEQHNNYQINANTIFQSSSSEKNELSMQKVLYSSIALPEKLHKILAEGHVIKLTDDDDTSYFYQKIDEQYLQRFGPLTATSKQENIEGFYVVLIFYSLLTILLVSFIWPLFRDLSKLQTKATSFGQQLNFSEISVKPSSAIYPLANTFNKMANQLVETMQMYQDLSRTIAHEIRTPLARMKFLSEIIADDITEQQKQRLEADIGEIHQLMKEYLSFERLENYQYLKERKLVSLNAFFTTMSEKVSFQDSPIAVEFNYPQITAFFNEKTMAVAVQNLINNAQRYASSTIVVHFNITDDFCLLSVSDDGPGVGKQATKLVQPFIRKEAEHEVESGYGLGLYIVRKVLIWHQGNLTLANSTTLSGAIITLKWPNKP